MFSALCLLIIVVWRSLLAPGRIFAIDGNCPGPRGSGTERAMGATCTAVRRWCVGSYVREKELNFCVSVANLLGPRPDWTMTNKVIIFHCLSVVLTWVTSTHLKWLDLTLLACLI